ncbi:glycosyltransferase [Arsenicicoccus cauae]|uniref:glycosyltransferase n=1 Tax=Arsenicicoccus cauae TaxID=2663847 RepID=UPI00370D14B6
MPSPAEPDAPPRLLVVVPAHDEERRLPACLTAVAAALERWGGRAEVVVNAHRCTDGTARMARATLRPGGPLSGLVVEDDTSATVGGVRDRAVRAALDRWSPDPCSTWLLSTDADSVVPAGWVASLLDAASARSAVAVAGLVELVDWRATPEARAAYDAIVRGGLTGPDTHEHAYAANLAVRLDAYLAVGGFPCVAHGEETALLTALAAAGWPVTSTRASVVRTSGRMPGRAREGLGQLLQQLTRP